MKSKNGPNFNYFAMHYLNCWYEFDEHFVCDIQSADEEIRRITLNEAARYYGVSRNFKKLETEGDQNRLSQALKMLDSIHGEAASNNIIKSIEILAGSLQNCYNKNVISAASKFLWIKFPDKVVILDSRVKKSLGIKDNDYKIYYDRWYECYRSKENEISDSCARLNKATEYSLRPKVPLLDPPVLQDWFKRRVFDKYLWFHGANDDL